MGKTQEFFSCIGDLLYDPKVQAMGEIAHHTQRISCLNHSLFVAYISYVLTDWFGGNREAVVKGGLLHDLYLCDWKKERSLFKHLRVHPEMAVRNARSFHLTPLEESIIRKHMWPVTFTKLPTRREEIIVSLADKFCAIAEVTGLYWQLQCCRTLSFAMAH